jgi:GH24 family phage-related lysozyme (muramidase)
MAKKKYNPNKKKIKEIISRANNSGANFVSRLKQKDRSYIPDWEVDGNIATHKMRAEIDGDGRAIVFPDVQEIEGVLHDFTDPKYGHKQWDSMDSAIHNNDTIIFDSLDEAIWFSENYKNYYPKFDKYKEGGNKSDWKPSENILKYLKSWEKFEPELYDDKKGNITIGYGFHLPHILKKYKNGITVEEADKEFEGVVNTFVPEFIRRTPNFENLNNNQRDALFSLFYNTGGPEYSKSPMLFKYLKEGDYDKAVKEINHDENDDEVKGQRKRRAFERRVFSTPTDRPWTVDDDSNYVLIEDKPVENESIEKDTNDSKYEDARHVEAKYGYTGYVGRGYDGDKVRISDSNIKSVGISNNADPDKWYESVNPILDTDPISLIADFIPTMKRMLDPNRERSGEDTATDFEEKMWKAYTDGDISRLPASKYRFDDDDDDAQYVGLPQEQAILIQSLLDKEYMNNMLDEAYKDADEKSKRKIRDYKKVLDKLNKNIFENPGKWILVNEGVSPFREEVYGDNFEKVNEASGLGALKNFSVRWDPDAGMLDVKDDYDFSRKKIAEDIIPERDVPLRIRERIKYDPKKGSILRNNDKALPKRFVRKYEEGGVVNKQREAYEYFTNKRGMSKIQALAIIGNLMAESGLKDDIYGDNRTSYGIQQWHNERMDKLFKHAKKKGHSTPTFKDQLEFLADEYEGKTGYSNFLYTRKGKEGPGYYNYSRQDFMNADNLKDAVVAWNQGAGRPHKSVIRNDDRYNYAMEVAKNLGLEIEENFGDDGEIAASVTLPEVEVAAALPNPEAPSQERQSEEERFRTWTETYGKDIVAHLLSLKEDKDDDKELRYQQHMKENEEDKRRAFIQSVLPSIQLRIKGVTEV